MDPRDETIIAQAIKIAALEKRLAESQEACRNLATALGNLQQANLKAAEKKKRK